MNDFMRRIKDMAKPKEKDEEPKEETYGIKYSLSSKPPKTVSIRLNNCSLSFSSTFL